VFFEKILRSFIMQKRTDLALERFSDLSSGGEGEIKGATKEEFESEGLKITKILIDTEAASKAIGKPIGIYYTVEIDSPVLNPASDCKAEKVISDIIATLLEGQNILIAGLGNPDITPDALGPYSARKIFVTRHIPTDMRSSFGLESEKNTASIAVGVLGQTGLESEETVSAATATTNADTVIVIDALAAGSIKRIGTSVQITDTGITPGSGVQGGRKSINKDSLGAKVIAIGVPMVVDALNIVSESGGDTTDMESFFVTPKDADKLTERLSKIISSSINRALFPEIPPKELEYLVL
jgi:spore protease